jgi:hypothetical protein
MTSTSKTVSLYLAAAMALVVGFPVSSWAQTTQSPPVTTVPAKSAVADDKEKIAADKAAIEKDKSTLKADKAKLRGDEKKERQDAATERQQKKQANDKK